jgi:hypothetical protein
MVLSRESSPAVERSIFRVCSENYRDAMLMRRNRSYLSAADRKKGITFKLCSGCGYEAAEVKELSELIFEQDCRVCGLLERYASIGCPAECGAKVLIEADYGSNRTCKCGHEVNSEELADALCTDFSDPSDFSPPINCGFCMSHASVVKHKDFFVCSECLSTSEDAPCCGWCNEYQIGGGDLEDSYLSGCEFCDGRSGWDSDD